MIVQNLIIGTLENHQIAKKMSVKNINRYANISGSGNIKTIEFSECNDTDGYKQIQNNNQISPLFNPR
jgi:hypothetical protein